MKEEKLWIMHPMFKRHKFIHSKCCNTHWELLYIPNTGLYNLRCEKCGKIGTTFEELR